jgi:hypothetical protein
MDTNKSNSLENFVERHRADFDAHEPRPDLWAALEQQLTAAVPAPRPAMRLAAAAGVAPVAAAARPNWFQRYGVAAALALLVMAAGASEAWKLSHKIPELTAAASTGAAARGRADGVSDAALYEGGTSMALPAAEHSVGADSQLVRAVRGMETYYTSQLARRQTELRQLNGPGVAGMTADWQRELVSLDSSYRKLKQELPRHPQPDAMLTAMNRNLQIRLDILDQQLHLGTVAEADSNSGAYVLADSRHQAE